LSSPGRASCDQLSLDYQGILGYLVTDSLIRDQIAFRRAGCR